MCYWVCVQRGVDKLLEDLSEVPSHLQRSIRNNGGGYGTYTHSLSTLTHNEPHTHTHTGWGVQPLAEVDSQTALLTDV
ncbi:hypothetical protein ES703_115789 [subsurface metagenome]